MKKKKAVGKIQFTIESPGRWRIFWQGSEVTARRILKVAFERIQQKNRQR